MMRRVLLLGCVLVVTGCGAAAAPRADVPMVPMHEDEQGATHDLDALGTWSDDPTYGAVWTPNDLSFVPYESYGQWVTLGDETKFVSDVPWALPTYASGRWVARPTQDGLRWCWAVHGTPAAIVPVDVGARALSPDPLRVADLTNEMIHARERENAARQAEAKLLAMQGAPPPDFAHQSQSGFLHSERNAHIPGTRHGRRR